MELILLHHTATSIHVICDGLNSHTFPLQSLYPITEQYLLQYPISAGKQIYAALFLSGTPAHGTLTTTPKRLLLVLDGRDLDAIPWEYAYGPMGNDSSEGYLVLSCPFVRGVLPAQRIELPAITQRMHIVAVPSNPLSDRIEPLNIEAEWMNLREIVQEIPSPITLERTHPATLERLRHLLANQQNRIVHFMGHGGHDTQGASLCFEREDGSLHPVLAKEFLQRIQGTTFLVMLNACSTATPVSTEFSNLAVSLTLLGARST